MATEADVWKIALALPGVKKTNDKYQPTKERLVFSVSDKGKDKGFVWSWMERVDPKKPRVENRDVLACRVANAEEKALLLAQDESKIFTEPHYNGYPAVLVRLANVSSGELERLIVEAWRCMAPKAVVAAYDAGLPIPTTKKPTKKPPKKQTKKQTKKPTKKPTKKQTKKPTKKHASKPPKKR
ncbi:MAG: MmcQ/YjbR family DNA-binding protein [Kofleriaceae bacterium]